MASCGNESYEGKSARFKKLCFLVAEMVSPHPSANLAVEAECLHQVPQSTELVGRQVRRQVAVDLRRELVG